MKNMESVKRPYRVNYLVVALVACILVATLLLFGLIHFFLPFHNLNTELLTNRGGLLGRDNAIEQQLLDRQEMPERVTMLSEEDEASSGFDTIMEIVGNNTTNLIVVGATLVMIAILAWLLKKNTEMRMIDQDLEDEDLRERAAEALAYATEMFNSAKDLVYQSHADPYNEEIQSEAMLMLQDADEAIDIATDLVMEYRDYVDREYEYAA